jgi:hypothetical protein
MKELMDILYASTLNDLPSYCRSFWDDDEDFVDWFVSQSDDTKIDVVADCVRRCLELNIRDTRNCFRMFMYCAKGSGNEYEDATPPSTPPSTEIQTITIPTLSTEHVKRIETLEKENAELKRRYEPAPVPVPAAVVPEVKRGRGRPPKYPNATHHRCLLCEAGVSSHGALFNHYHSKSHTNKVNDVLTRSLEVIKNSDKKLKIIVNVCNRRDDPKLSVEDPTEDDVENLRCYVADGINPISDILLVEGKELTYPTTGRKYFTWKKVL